MSRFISRSASALQIVLFTGLMFVGAMLFSQKAAAEAQQCCGDASCDIMVPGDCPGGGCTGNVNGTPIDTCCQGTDCNVY